MEQFVVSARKYRPQSFDDVVGQSHITETLKREIESGHLAQAFLFTGPRGVGKTTCARILAKEINLFSSELKEEDDFSYNVFELDAASNNSVEDIRELINAVRVPPQKGNYKVYIIDEVHMLSQSAFNAFLKTLEEPPKYAIFILATTEKHKVLPTILSRCQIFNFNRIQLKDAVDYLSNIAKKENVNAEIDALHLIAQKADGGMRDALSIFDQLVSFCDGNITYEKALENLNVLDSNYYFRLTEHILAENVTDTLLLFDEINKKGYDGQEFLSGLMSHFRNLLLFKSEETIKLIDTSNDIKAKYFDLKDKVEPSLIINSMNVINDFIVNLSTSRNIRLHTELCLIKLCHIPTYISLIDEDLKKKD